MQLPRVLARHPALGKYSTNPFRRLCCVDMVACSTLGDTAPEETSGGRHSQQRGNTHPASRLAKDGDVIRFTAESSDVLLHPHEGSDLVEHAEVGIAIPQVEKAIGPQAIVNGDTDDPITGKARAVIRQP